MATQARHITPRGNAGDDCGNTGRPWGGPVMTVYAHELVELATRFRREIDALAARDPQHRQMIEGTVIACLARDVLGPPAMPFIQAAIGMRKNARSEESA